MSQLLSHRHSWGFLFPLLLFLPIEADSEVACSIGFIWRPDGCPDTLVVGSGGLDHFLTTTRERADLNVDEGVADRCLVEKLDSGAMDLLH